MRIVWESQVVERYLDLVHTWKRKGVRRDSIFEEDWPHWLKYWAKPEARAKSKATSRNRWSKVSRPGTSPTHHTGGSKSIIEHTRDLARELGQEPNAYEIFMKLHMKKLDGQFVDSRSKEIATS